ncbi:MAG: type II toxin-antitoxin system RelE/ParE family toxin [Micropepsaceae bacterium]
MQTSPSSFRRRRLTILNPIVEAVGREIADRFIARLVAHCESFSRAPLRGTVRDDIRVGLRVVGWRRTVTIAFAVDEAARRVDVAGVFYRGRDVAGAMAGQ